MNSQIANAETGNGETRPAYMKPKYEIRVEDNAYVVDVHLPSVSRDNVAITHKGDMLFTEASRAPCKQPEWRVLHTEIRGEGHRLDFQLNVEIDSEGVTAKSDLGILSVRLPLVAKATQRTIAVAVG
jgi:HSP20 family molecular chaperone IbpA